MTFFGNPRFARWALNLYPPYLGTGIRVREITPDWREISVQMKLHWYNRNFVGTHFGGSLFTMTDPFYMLMLIHVLGDEYVVWDKASHIDFIRPGRGTVTAFFRLGESEIEQIKRVTDNGAKYLGTFTVSVIDARGDAVAKVDKTIYVRPRKVRSTGG